MKIIKIESCEKCPHSWNHIGLAGLRCKTTGRKYIEDASVIPNWCPLVDAVRRKRDD